MRTTLDIDDSVLAAARAVVPDEYSTRFPNFPVGPHSRPVTGHRFISGVDRRHGFLLPERVAG